MIICEEHEIEEFDVTKEYDGRTRCKKCGRYVILQ